MMKGEFRPVPFGPLNGSTPHYAGSGHAVVHDRLLRFGVFLRQSLREVEVATMNADVITVIALILSILLFGYLALTLLFPEKF